MMPHEANPFSLQTLELMLLCIPRVGNIAFKGYQAVFDPGPFEGCHARVVSAHAERNA